MVWVEKIIDFWFRAAALIFTGAVLLVCGLLVVTNLWLVPLGLLIIALIHWRRQAAAEQSPRFPPAPPDLIDKIGRGVTGLLALFAAGIALVLGLALLVAHPWLIIFSLAAFWLWRKARRRPAN